MYFDCILYVLSLTQHLSNLCYCLFLSFLLWVFNLATFVTQVEVGTLSYSIAGLPLCLHKPYKNHMKNHETWWKNARLPTRMPLASAAHHPPPPPGSAVLRYRPWGQPPSRPSTATLDVPRRDNSSTTWGHRKWRKTWPKAWEELGQTVGKNLALENINLAWNYRAVVTDHHNWWYKMMRRILAGDLQGSYEAKSISIKQPPTIRLAALDFLLGWICLGAICFKGEPIARKIWTKMI